MLQIFMYGPLLSIMLSYVPVLNAQCSMLVTKVRFIFWSAGRILCNRWTQLTDVSVPTKVSFQAPDTLYTPEDFRNASGKQFFAVVEQG